MKRLSYHRGYIMRFSKTALLLITGWFLTCWTSTSAAQEEIDDVEIEIESVLAESESAQEEAMDAEKRIKEEKDAAIEKAKAKVELLKKETHAEKVTLVALEKKWDQTSTKKDELLKEKANTEEEVGVSERPNRTISVKRSRKRPFT